MKKVIDFVLMLAVGVLAYIPCRELAVIERGNEFIGGEICVPVMILVAYVLISDWIEERKIREERIKAALVQYGREVFRK